MEAISAGEAEGRDAFDPIVWPLCGTFTTVDGCWLAPRVPPALLHAALVSYLDLVDDEILLVVLDGGTEKAPKPVAALTTQRIYWPAARAMDQSDRELAPPRCAFVRYADLPAPPMLTGSGAIDLGDGRSVPRLPNRAAAETLLAFLAEARGRATENDALPEISFAARDQARRTWPDVLRADLQARAFQAALHERRSDVRQLQARTMVVTRLRATPLLAGACVAVFVAMVLSGVSPFMPRTDAMLRWGALASPLVVAGQWWRLLTCVFLHFGVLHLALNMWGLVVIGRAVERFFGHLGFAALYLLSGFGGALASLYFHPFGICAGASGAVFGLIGGLLAFLVVRRRDFPASILKPVRRNALAFVAINLAFSAAVPSIDMAAHVVGLVTGFVVGLGLAPNAVTRADRVGLLRRAAVIAVLALGLAGAGRVAIAATRVRLAEHSAAGAPRLDQAAEDFIAFQHAGQETFEALDRTSRGLADLVKAVDRGKTPPEELIARTDELMAETDRNAERVRALPQPNDEVRAMVDQLLASQRHLRRALGTLWQAVATGDQQVLDAPDGFQPQVDQFFTAQKEFVRLREAYIKRHGLAEE